MKTSMFDCRVCAGLSLAVMISLQGCATYPARPTEPRVKIPDPAAPAAPAPGAALDQESSTGQLVTFGKLRTVIVADERIVNTSGEATRADEIRPELEKELVQRDFRVFSGSVAPDDGVAELTRKTKAHLVLQVVARSELINSTGRFSKHRATGEIKAIRGHDGSILAVARREAVGPRQQSGERAGQLALREIQPLLTRELIEKLMEKSDQLLWAGLIVDNVSTMEMAVHIQNWIEQQPFTSYAELLEWDRRSQTATYEIIYGLKHESDLAALLADIPGISRIRTGKYEPGSMEVFTRTLENFK